MEKVTYAVVAFRVDRYHSVLYQKAATLEKCLHWVRVAFEGGGADFISLRRIVEKGEKVENGRSKVQS